MLDEDFIPEIEIIASICARLVTIDIQSDVVRLVHYTTQEYFERTSWFLTAEDEITEACITYLSSSTFDDGLCRTYQQYKKRPRINKLFQYAPKNWGHHTRKATEEVNNLVLELLERKDIPHTYSELLFFPEIYSSDVEREAKKITGLHIVAYFGLEEVTRDLIKRGHISDPRDWGGRMPLSWAAEKGHEAVVKLLLANNANPDSKDRIYGRTPLLWAIMYRKEVVVKLLLAENADPDSKDSRYGRTPLSWAVEKGHGAVVKLLLEMGRVDPQSKDASIETPLSKAAYHGYETVLELLLASQATQAGSRDHYGRTLLWWAAAGGHKAVVRMLLMGYNSDPYVEDNFGQTPLSRAARKGNVDVTRFLLEKYKEDGIPTGDEELTTKTFPEAGSESDIACDICRLRVLYLIPY